MKKIYYSVVQEVEVPDDMTPEQVDALIAEKASGKDYLWSDKDNLFVDDFDEVYK